MNWQLRSTTTPDPVVIDPPPPVPDVHDVNVQPVIVAAPLRRRAPEFELRAARSSTNVQPVIVIVAEALAYRAPPPPALSEAWLPLKAQVVNTGDPPATRTAPPPSLPAGAARLD